MRDPNRMGPILSLLGEVWAANPDMRLGQIVENLSKSNALGGDIDTIQIEDDELGMRLQKVITGGWTSE